MNCATTRFWNFSKRFTADTMRMSIGGECNLIVQTRGLTGILCFLIPLVLHYYYLKIAVMFLPKLSSAVSNVSHPFSLQLWPGFNGGYSCDTRWWADSGEISIPIGRPGTAPESSLLLLSWLATVPSRVWYTVFQLSPLNQVRWRQRRTGRSFRIRFGFACAAHTGARCTRVSCVFHSSIHAIDPLWQ